VEGQRPALAAQALQTQLPQQQLPQQQLPQQQLPQQQLPQQQLPQQQHAVLAALRGVQRLLCEVKAGAPEIGRLRWNETIDPSISNTVSARWGNMKRPPARQGLTFNDAEATAGSVFPGIQRHAAPHVVMATADAQSNLHEPGRKKSTVRTRARSAMTRPWLVDAEGFSGERRAPNLASGAGSMPALTVGNLVQAQT
jgi:hypothetical protein